MKTENKIHNVWDKFKLKKDLPTWKAWEEMWIGEDWCLYWTTKEWDVIMVYHVSTLLKFNILNSEWFDKEEKSIFNLKEWDDIYIMRYDDYISRQRWWKQFVDDRINWNVYLTKEEAEKELERRKAIQRIKKFMWENKIKNKEFKWNNGKYLICYDYLKKSFCIGRYLTFYLITDLWYFETYEDCQKIIDNCEDDLKIIYNI